MKSYLSAIERAFQLAESGSTETISECPAIDGILKEGAEIMEEHEPGAGLDAALAASAQAVEHYETARYGTLVDWATELGLDDAVKLLGETLAQEEATDQALREMATSDLNTAANEDPGADTAMKSGLTKSKSSPKRAA